MAITFNIPGPLRDFAGGRSSIKLSAPAATVREAFEALWALHPAIRDRVLNEQGEVREHINVFVGDESIRFTGGLSTRLEGNVEITIVPAVSGGSF